VVEASLVVSRGLKTTYEFESTRMGDESFEASRREATQEDIPGTVRGAYQKLPMLSTLVLAGNQEISNQTLKYLSYSNSITKLKSLDLRWTRISDDGLIEFMSTSNCSNLQLLDVSYQHEKVTSAFLSAFALSQYCKKLTVLLCRNCDISDVGIADMIESDNTLNIEELDFGTFDDGKRKQRLSSRKKTTSKV
jgi:hypothetical protein